MLYIFWFLHQTTTNTGDYRLKESCISFDSYIKPQHLPRRLLLLFVVYLLIPTSNHNHVSPILNYLVLYIFWFLHQTTTKQAKERYNISCISFDSYIKPQPAKVADKIQYVVYLLIPTSNHNFVARRFFYTQLYIFWFLHQTTTMRRIQANKRCCISFDSYIKPQLNDVLVGKGCQLYIFWFLHQTTTSMRGTLNAICCISFDSYIKPQLISEFCALRIVVYLLIPTSNHNTPETSVLSEVLYIFWFLHQTTTELNSPFSPP